MGRGAVRGGSANSDKTQGAHICTPFWRGSGSCVNTSETDRTMGLSEPTNRTAALIEEICYGLVSLACAANMAWVLVREMMPTFQEGVAMDLFHRECQRTIETPYIYRVLTPAIINGLHAVTRIAGDDLAMLVLIAALLAYTYTFRALICAVYGNTIQTRTFSFVSWLLLPFLYILPFCRYFHIYDIPSLAFFTAGLLLIFRRRWLGFVLVFVLATLNRETSCFLAVVYLLVTWGDKERVRTLGRAAILAGIWVTIKVVLYYAYRGHITGHTGHIGLFLPSLGSNLQMLFRSGDTIPAHVWMQLLGVFGGLWVPVLLFYTHIENPFTRRSILVAPLWVAGMFCVAQINELRHYGELSPLLLLGVFDLMAGRTAKPPAK